jgi:hypothetical protein
VLLNLGNDAREAVPALQDVAKEDADARVRSHATKALEKIQKVP